MGIAAARLMAVYFFKACFLFFFLVTRVLEMRCFNSTFLGACKNHVFGGQDLPVTDPDLILSLQVRARQSIEFACVCTAVETVSRAPDLQPACMRRPKPLETQECIFKLKWK